MAPDASAELHKFISAAKEHGATDESLKHFGECRLAKSSDRRPA